MSDAECPRCGDDNLTDYPVCPSCARIAHFPHRDHCIHCHQECWECGELTILMHPVGQWYEGYQLRMVICGPCHDRLQAEQRADDRLREAHYWRSR